jgi:hypothetical protein
MSTNPAPLFIIPAKAGIHLLSPATHGGWTPACAGVTRWVA